MKLKKKSMTVLVIVIMLSICMIGSYSQVKASEITPFAYYDPSAVSFYGNHNFGSKYYNGNNMSIEAIATAEDGVSREIITEIYVLSTNTTYRYRTYTDGVHRIVNNIPLNGGSNVSIIAYCSDSSIKVTLDLKMYSA